MKIINQSLAIRFVCGALCAFFWSVGVHALPCDGNGRETCVKDKKPSTVITEQNNSPCYGCQAPDPAAPRLPSGKDDGTFRTNPADRDTCKSIAKLTELQSVATANGNVARASISGFEVAIAGYEHDISDQEAKVGAAAAKVPKGAVVTAGTAMKCTAKLRALDQCADYDPSAVSGAMAALDTERGKLARLKGARDDVQGQLNRAKDAIKNELAIRARLNQLKNSDEGKACRK